MGFDNPSPLSPPDVLIASGGYSFCCTFTPPFSNRSTGARALFINKLTSQRFVKRDVLVGRMGCGWNALSFVKDLGIHNPISRAASKMDSLPGCEESV